MKNWEAKDWVIMVLIGVMVYFMSLLSLSKIMDKPQVDNEMSLQFLSAILTIVSMYIGSRLNNKKE